jgi:SAM-dependent methyltransferase
MAGSRAAACLVVYDQDGHSHYIDDVDTLDASPTADRPDDGLLLEAVGSGFTGGILRGGISGSKIEFVEKKSSYIHGTAEEEQERLALLNRLTNAPFLEFLNLCGDEQVLEVGSGLGILAAEVSGKVPGGSVIGLEYSEDQLAKARSLEAASLSFQKGDAHHLPFEDSSFDVVYCRYVLEHLTRPADAVAEMHRVLRPGGRALAQENNILIIEFYPVCPTFDHVWRQFAVLQGQLGGDALIGKKLFPLFMQAGFEKIELSLEPEIHWSGSPNFRMWMQNVIGNVESGKDNLLERGLATGAEIEAAIDEVSGLMQRDDASMIFYWNRVVGIKR